MTAKCEWIGEDEGCNKTAIPAKSYCATHYERIYLTVLPEMATYIVEKELKNDRG
jgi:hypothetical protein